MARGWKCDGCGAFVEGNADGVVQQFVIFKRGPNKLLRQIHLADYCADCAPGVIDQVETEGRVFSD